MVYEERMTDMTYNLIGWYFYLHGSMLRHGVLGVLLVSHYKSNLFQMS